MKEHRINLIIYFVCLALLTPFLYSCKAPGMVPPASLSDTIPFKVGGSSGLFSDKKITFGPYLSSSIKRSWIHGSGSTNFYRAREKNHQRYHFVLSRSKQELWDVECYQEASYKGLELDGWEFGIDQRSQLSCTMVFVSDITRKAYLHMAATDKHSLTRQQEPLSGYLSKGKGNIRIEGISNGRTLFSRVGTRGFNLYNDSRIVAVVEVANKGRVWFDASLEEQESDLLAAASSALLIYEDLRKTLND